MITTNEKVVEPSVESSNTKFILGDCWEGGNEMVAGSCFVAILFP